MNRSPSHARLPAASPRRANEVELDLIEASAVLGLAVLTWAALSGLGAVAGLQGLLRLGGWLTASLIAVAAVRRIWEWSTVRAGFLVSRPHRRQLAQAWPMAAMRLTGRASAARRTAPGRIRRTGLAARRLRTRISAFALRF